VKHLGRLLALAGLALAVALFARENPGAIFSLVAAAGTGLVLAALFHVVPMTLNARAWQLLLPGAKRPRLLTMTWAVWVRESVNGLLPVARIGGEIVSFRLLRQQGVRAAPAAAGLVVDMTLSVLSQLVFSLLGVGLLVALGRPAGLATDLLLGLLVMVPLCIAFILVQRAGAFRAVTGALNKLVSGRLQGALSHSARIDRAVRVMYLRRDALIGCFTWQLTGWLSGAGEIWLALYFLGYPSSIGRAVAIEALIQAASSAAFVVPGALGVQEGAFLLVGAALGLNATTALALATARRLRDVVVFFPGLLAWHWFEARGTDAARWAKQSR